MMSLRASSLTVLASLLVHAFGQPMERTPEPTTSPAAAAASQVERCFQVSRPASAPNPDDDAHLLAVRNVVDRLTAFGTPTIREVEEALVDEFGDVSGHSFDQEYIWVWDIKKEKWEWICFAKSTFDVNPRRDANPVRVTVEDRVVLE